MEAAIFVMIEIPSDWAGSAGESRARDVSLLSQKRGRGGGNAAVEAAVYVLMITNPGKFMNGPRFCDINLSCLRLEGGCGHENRRLYQDAEQEIRW